eukprot:6399378-Pyramimonas_sp.AAC.1
MTTTKGRGRAPSGRLSSEEQLLCPPAEGETGLSRGQPGRSRPRPRVARRSWRSSPPLGLPLKSSEGGGNLGERP